MKKTTTRLATTTAVLVMSVFAILLAQYDARKSVRHEDAPSSPSDIMEPPIPLAISNWPGENAVVRANNSQRADFQYAEPEYTDYSSAKPVSVNQNPLRETEPAPIDLDSLGTLMEDSLADQVVTASGELPTEPEFPLAPNANASLQPLPSAFGEGTAISASPPPIGSNATLGLPPGAIPAGTTPSTTGTVPSLGPGLSAAPPNVTSIGAPPPKQSANSTSNPSTAIPVFANTAPFPTASNMTPLNAAAPSNAQANFPSANFSGNQLGSIPSTQPSMATPTQFSNPANNGANEAGFPQGNASANPDKNAVAADDWRGNANSQTSPDVGRSTVGSSASAMLVSNQPGSRFLDGSQNPIMQIQKRAPEEITVGKRATFMITVRNAGNATAHEVTVVDRVPRGSRFTESSPNVKPTSDGTLVWKLGEVAAGEEKSITLQIVPEVEGEVGSVASVHFVAQASVRTLATAPQLDLQVDSSGPVIIGQPQQLAVTIRNAGTGVAKAVRLEADIPAQLRHESGESQLEALIGDLRPSESKRLVLNVAAVQPGQSVCPVRAVNEDGVQAQGQFSVDVRAPQLAASITGPGRRYLERQATYQILVNNTGTTTARNLYFEVNLPAGLRFVASDIAQATYHPEKHLVTLGLPELNEGASAAFDVSVLPVELGPQNIRVNVMADLNITAEAKQQMVVEGLSELSFTIGQDNGTVEVGANTTYTVQVANVGNQSDKNVQLNIQLPDGAKLLKVDAPVEYRADSNRLSFAPVAEMRSRDHQTFRFQVQHNQAGNQVVRAQLTSANWPVAVVKEEGTLVYNDQ